SEPSEEEALAASGADERVVVPLERQAAHAGRAARGELRPHRPVHLRELARHARGDAELHPVLRQIPQRRRDGFHFLLGELLREDDRSALEDLRRDRIVHPERAGERPGGVVESGGFDFDDDQTEFAGFGCHNAGSYLTVLLTCPYGGPRLESSSPNFSSQYE